jgi:hypothetical protein
MWPHFINLFHRSSESFLVALGTTGLGWWVQGIIWFFATEIATYLVVWFLRGKDAMKARAGENFRIGFYAWLVVMVCVYTPIFGWNVVKVIYNDHSNLVAENRHLLASESGLVDPQSRDDEIYELQKEIGEYKKTQSSEVRIYPISHDLRPGVPKLEYVLTTGKMRTPVEIVSTCDFPISAGTSRFLTVTGGSSETTDHRRISERQYRFLIVSPVWSSSTPLWITVFFEGTVDRMPSCSFSVK